MSVIKLMFILFDVMLFILGFVMLGIGILILTNEGISRQDEEEPIVANGTICKVAYVVIFVGCILLLFGFMGVLYVFVRCIILLSGLESIYMILLLVIVMLIVWNIEGNEKIKTFMEEKLHELWHTRGIFRRVEIVFKCCGIGGPEEYTKVPDSCYYESGTILHSYTSSHAMSSNVLSIRSCPDKSTSFVSGTHYTNKTVGVILRHLTTTDEISRAVNMKRDVMDRTNGIVMLVHANETIANKLSNQTMNLQGLLYSTGCLDMFTELGKELWTVIFGLSLAILVTMGISLIIIGIKRARYLKNQG